MTDQPETPEETSDGMIPACTVRALYENGTISTLSIDYLETPNPLDLARVLAQLATANLVRSDTRVRVHARVPVPGEPTVCGAVANIINPQSSHENHHCLLSNHHQPASATAVHHCSICGAGFGPIPGVTP